MGFWFNEKDTDKDVFENSVGKHTPNSIKQEARQELRQRGYSNRPIDDYAFEHDD
ncbi:hypothetical protein [Inconstantimicrobium porci]|uniref:hypothetical protein n=1 Tax=Inconstantimicrobium porci TaxID=2652291 RepID=UPI0012B2F311|nr:hypothetical protein [Inconstantimicrobium porci]